CAAAACHVNGCAEGSSCQHSPDTGSSHVPHVPQSTPRFGPALRLTPSCSSLAMMRVSALLPAIIAVSCGGPPATPAAPGTRAAPVSIPVSSARAPDVEDSPPAPASPRAGCPTNSTAADSATHIRDVDWCNHDYGEVTLRNGVGERSG